MYTFFIRCIIAYSPSNDATNSLLAKSIILSIGFNNKEKLRNFSLRKKYERKNKMV
jgi:hypothetical protein